MYLSYCQTHIKWNKVHLRNSNHCLLSSSLFLKVLIHNHASKHSTRALKYERKKLSLQTDPAKQVTSCRTEVDRTDWTVSGSCDVDKSYASDNQYTCLWFHLAPSGVGNLCLNLLLLLLIAFIWLALEQTHCARM